MPRMFALLGGKSRKGTCYPVVQTSNTILMGNRIWSKFILNCIYVSSTDYVSFCNTWPCKLCGNVRGVKMSSFYLGFEVLTAVTTNSIIF
jgi:hypothetical protein